MIELPGGALVDIPETVLEVGAVTIHEHKARARTIERWKNKDGFQALSRTYLPEIREAENALWMVWVSRFVNYAQNEQLNMIGRLVGELRQGRADANYRLRILARIVINKSFGTAADILAMLAVIEPTAATVTDLGPASFRVDFAGVLQGFSSFAELASLIAETRAAGVGGSAILPTDDTTGLRWSDVANPFRKLRVRAFAEDEIVGVGSLDVPIVDGGASSPVAGSRLFLHQAIEDNNDVATPSGWTLVSNVSFNVFRQKVWTKIATGAETGTVALGGPVAGGGSVARIYEVCAPDMTVGTIDAESGTSAVVSAPGLAAPCWGLAFISYESGATITAFKDGGGSPRWNKIDTEVGMANCSISAQYVNAVTTNPDDSWAADMSASDNWIMIGFALGTRVLNGWNHGKLANRKSA